MVMKKSEMQMVLLRTFGKMDVNNPDGYDYNDLAEFVLEEIEKAGMLPPLVTVDDGDYFLKNVNVWEKE